MRGCGPLRLHGEREGQAQVRREPRGSKPGEIVRGQAAESERETETEEPPRGWPWGQGQDHLLESFPKESQPSQ